MNENPIRIDDRTTSSTNASTVSDPRVGRRRLTSYAVIGIMLASLLLSNALDHANAGTGVDSSAVAAVDSVETDMPADTSVSRNDGEHVSGPVVKETVGLTVGERLKNLDSLMTVLPADRLPQLMMEYERILDSAMLAQGATPARTSRPTSSHREIASQPTSSEPSSITLSTSSFAPLASPVVEHRVSETTTSDEPTDVTTSSQPLGFIKSQPRSAVANTSSNTLVQSDYLNADSSKNRQFDPSEYKGIRKSEIERYERKSADRPKRVTSTSKRSATAKRSTAARPRTQRARVERSEVGRNARRSGTIETPSIKFRTKGRTTTSGDVSDHDRAFTNGLALVRAGKYAEAVAPLSVAVKGSKSYRSTATYYLAISQAHAGDIASATPTLSALKNGSGPLSDKAWIAYARLLGADGKCDQARSELVRFLKVRRYSSLTAEARAALQQI